MVLTYNKNETTFDLSWPEENFTQNALVGLSLLDENINLNTVYLKINEDIRYEIQLLNKLSKGAQILIFELNNENKTGSVKTYSQPILWQ